MTTLLLLSAAIAQIGNLGSMSGTNPIVFRDVVVILAGILGAVALIWQTWGPRRRDPGATPVPSQPVTIHDDRGYVSAQEHEQFRQIVLDRMGSLESVIAEMRREAKTDREHLTKEMLALERRIADDAQKRDANTHQRINDVVEQLAQLVGSIGHLMTEVRQSKL